MNRRDVEGPKFFVLLKSVGYFYGGVCVCVLGGRGGNEVGWSECGLLHTTAPLSPISRRQSVCCMGCRATQERITAHVDVGCWLGSGQ